MIKYLNNNNHLIIFANIWIFILISYNTHSQDFNYYSDLKDKNPEAQALIVKKLQHLNIEVDGEELKIYSDNFQEKYFISDKADAFADEYIYYNSFMDIDNVSACLLASNGKKFKKEQIKDIKISNNFSDYAFFDDSKLLKITYPKINPGDRSILEYKETYKGPFFLSSFYFGSYIKTLEAEYVVTVPKNVKIEYKIFNNQEDKINFTKKEKGKYTIFSWKVTGLDKFDFSNSGFHVSYYQPHIVIFVNEFESNGKVKKVLSDVNDLHKLYYSWVKNVNTTNDEKLKYLVDSLVLGISTTEDKIQQIYYWVQDNIKYIAFEDGLSGFVPASATQVFNSRYGDCKGMSSILVQMLRMAGVDAHWTWIGTRHLPYSYYELPTPKVDNHMIATVKVNNQNIFLDATAKFLPISFPSGFIQGKDALVSLDENSYEIAKVPVIDKEKNTITDILNLEISTNDLKASGTITYTGYNQINLAERLNRNSFSKAKNVLKLALAKGNNKFRLDTFNYETPLIRDNPLNINYLFTLPGYVKSFQDKKYVNINIDTYLNDQFLDKAKEPFANMLENKHIQKNIYSISIPAGYEVSFLPSEEKYEEPEFGFRIFYQISDNKVIMNKEIYLDLLMIDNQLFDKWNKMISKLNSAANQSIVFKQK